MAMKAVLFCQKQIGGMGKNSSIQWTGSTWNPWQGCRKVSPGCKFCYMYRDKEKYGQDPMVVHRSADATFNKPLTWKDPAMVFTCSWSDWFIEEADAWREDAWNIIKKTPHLTYQILTKRPDRIAACLPGDWGSGYQNVWIGVSAENQEMYDQRLPILASIPARVRFLSIEPLIGPIQVVTASTHEALASGKIHWVIIGGESGNETGRYRYRPCKVEWMRDVSDVFKLAGVPVFVKQLGTYLAKELMLRDRSGGDEQEFPPRNKGSISGA